MSNAWQYSVLKAASWLVSKLPYGSILKMGAAMGNLYYTIAKKQRERAYAQLGETLALPPQEAETVIRQLFRHLGQTFMEVLYMPALTPERIQQYVTIENRDYLTEAVAQGRGVVFLTGHVGNWEWLGATLAMAGFPMTSVIKRQPNDQHTRLLNEYRQMVGIEIFARGTTELVAAAKAMKKGKILGFLADQDGREQGIFLDFLGKMASTPTGPAVFAKRFQAPVIPAFIVRQPAGGHRVIIHPPLQYVDTGDEAADIRRLTEAMTKVMTDMIRQYPSQWLWFQKRWSTPYSKQENSAANE